MKKKSTVSFNLFSNKSSFKKCDEVNCEEIGEYVAPKSPNSSEKYHFCLEHIKTYNKRWNYFAGKSQEEIYEFQKNDFFEGKPTKPFSTGSASKIKFQFKFVFDKNTMKFSKRKKKFNKTNNNVLDEQIEQSLITLNLQPDVDNEKLKKQYKLLVKKYHPDVKNHLDNKETKIKEINKAYKILQKFVNN